MRLLRRTTLLLLTMTALCATALAQTATGEVNGTVTDPNGAVVNGATAKLINQATNIEVQVKPNRHRR